MDSPKKNISDGTSKMKIQKIVWKENKDFASSAVFSSAVEVNVGSPDHSILGSSAVVTKSISDYPFMMPASSGAGVAEHCSQDYIAYAINKKNDTSEFGGAGMVRVLNHTTGKRGLIRDIKGLVMDLSFAWIKDFVVLAFTDTSGAFSVYQASSVDDEQKLCMRKVLEVAGRPAASDFAFQNVSSKGPLNQVTWCHYIPESPTEAVSEDPIPSHLLAVSTGNVVHVWLVHHLCGGPGISLDWSDDASLASTKALKLRIVCKSSVMTVCFSPDSTCIAVATAHGQVYFFQADILGDLESEGSDELQLVPEQTEEESVHEWEPHDGASVSCLLFLDDYTFTPENSENGGSFWAFALTGAHNNTELKIWNCKTWECLQVLHLHIPTPAPGPKVAQSSSAPPFPNPPGDADRSASLSPSLLSSSPASKHSYPSLQVSADNSTNFIMLTDRSRNVLYALLLDHTPPFENQRSDESRVNGEASGEKKQELDAPAGDDGAPADIIKRIVSISEVPVQFEPFSLTISSAKMKTYQRWKHHALLDGANNDGEIAGNGGDCAMERGLVVRSNVLTKESLLQCSLRLQPTLPPARHFCSVSALLKYAPAGDLPANPAPQLLSPADSSKDISMNSTFSFGAKDGLSDLSLSGSELVGSVSSSTPEQMKTEKDLTKNNSVGPKHEIPLGALLPPDHFQAAPSAPALSSQSLLSSATSRLPPPPVASPSIDQSLNNTPNATLAALLLYPEAQPVIAGRGPVADLASRAGISTAPPEVSPSFEIAQLLGIGSSSNAPHASKVCPKISEQGAAKPDPAVSMFGPIVASAANAEAALRPATGLHDRTGSVSGLAGVSAGHVELASPAVRSSSVPLSSAAAASSSTSSPSLEIQQILQQSDDQSSSSSSMSSSRGPTQLEMAEEDSHLPQDALQQPTSDEDQPEALREVASGIVPPVSASLTSCNTSIPCDNGNAATSHVSSAAASLGEISGSVAVPVYSHSSAAKVPSPAVAALSSISRSTTVASNVPGNVAVSSNNELDVKDINGKQSILTESDLKLHIAGGVTEEELDRQTVRSTHMKLLEEQRNKEKKIQETIKEHQLELHQKLQKKIVKIPASPAKNQDVPKAVAQGMWSQAQQLDVSSAVGYKKIAKGNETPKEIEASINAFDILKQIVPDVSLRNTDEVNAQPANAAASALALCDILKNSESSAQLTCEQLEARIRASPVPGLNGEQRMRAPELPEREQRMRAPELPERTQRATTPADRLPHTEAVNGAAVTNKLDSAKTKRVDISTSELKELRSLLHTTQQQVAKLNKKVDELSANQKSQSSQAVASAIRPGLEATLRLEIKQTLPNCVSKAVEHAINQKLSHELQRMVSATEARLGDNIAKLVHSRSLSAAISENVAATVAPSVTAACKDAYSKLVLPGLNSVTARTLQQFNDLFLKGTSDYVGQVKNEVSNVVTCIEGSKSSSVREMEAARTNMTAMATLLQDQLQQQQNAIQLITSQVLSENVVRRIVSEEVARALQRVPPPDTPTPNTFYGPDKAPNPKQAQLQLEQFIAAKQFNSAFKQALSANDVSQVLFVCERVNRETLMAGGKSKLSQEVLMSLITQLSHDLGQKTDLKMKFLEDAMLCIDPANPITRDHICSVASCLRRNLQLYLNTNPPPQTQNRFRMLLLAANHHAGGA